jgi:hypothetical protein
LHSVHAASSAPDRAFVLASHARARVHFAHEKRTCSSAPALAQLPSLARIAALERIHRAFARSRQFHPTAHPARPRRGAQAQHVARVLLGLGAVA